MANITDAKLHIHHDHGKNTAKPHVTCNVHFTGTELCLMKACPEQKMFKLKCQLWGADSGFTGADDYLYTYSHIHYIPHPAPVSPVSLAFEATVGEGLLDEDWGTDEVYGKLILYNLFTFVQFKRNTNTVSHNF